MGRVIASGGAEWEKIAAEVWATLREVAEGNRALEERQNRFHAEMEAERRARAEDHRKTEESLRVLQEEGRETDKRIRVLQEEGRETDKRIRALQEEGRETDRRIRALQEEGRETDRRIRALQEEGRKTERQIRKTDRTFNDQWGKLMESLVEGDLVQLLQRRGVKVTEVYARRHPLGDARQRELDILAWNGSDVVAVEVKTTLLVKDVRRFEETMWEVPTLLPLKGALRYYGAVAYLRAESKAQIYAERRGFFVIRATGSSASLTNAEEFRPRDFSSPPRDGA